MYTSLQNVKQAINVERKLIEYLRTYIDSELERLEDIKRSKYEEEEADLPKEEDLRGAAKGLMRLQDVYSLQVSSLVKGRFQRITNGGVIDVCSPAVSVSLSGDDCFLVGKVAYEQEDYYHSVQWLEESVRLFRGAGGQWSPENEGTLEDALDHLAFSHFKNVEKYEKLLGSAGPSRECSLRRPGSSYLRTRDTYERLCLTKGSQVFIKIAFFT
ncbi:hypothetical protein GOODEAATRI_017743 [Goodea atripinnis]|uniref:Prolyl 4-hydroxylase alpha-subunit N-terminal domain-containing protein n=1 Tax=Goodea atripinnis TaxID=208336 RepID=A0ABV0MLP6_9TELE